MLFVLNTQGEVNLLKRRGDGEFLLKLEPSLYEPILMWQVWLESCCWFCPVCLHLSEVAPEACACSLPLVWLYYLNAWFPVVETWGSPNHQPVLWKSGVVLLNPVFCLRCFFPYILWPKEALVSMSPGLPESLALPLRFIVLRISLRSLPGTGKHLLLLCSSTWVRSFARFSVWLSCFVELYWKAFPWIRERKTYSSFTFPKEPREGLHIFNFCIPVKMFIGVCWKVMVPSSQCALPSVCQFTCIAVVPPRSFITIADWLFSELHC